MFDKTIRTEDEELLARVRLERCAASVGVAELCYWPSDAHHVTTKKTGGGDVENNVMPLCRRHHNEWHRRGAVWMSEKYQGVKKWLTSRGRGDVLDRASARARGCL